jgi:hypothetical protein
MEFSDFMIAFKKNAKQLFETNHNLFLVELDKDQLWENTGIQHTLFYRKTVGRSSRVNFLLKRAQGTRLHWRIAPMY